MKFFFVVLALTFAPKVFASNCEAVKAAFVGIYSVQEYICESNDTSHCYSDADSFSTASKVFVTRVPDGRGTVLSIQLLSVKKTLVEEYTISEYAPNKSEQVTCNDADISKSEDRRIRSELFSNEAVRASTMLAQRKEHVEFEIFLNLAGLLQKKTLRLIPSKN